MSRRRPGTTRTMSTVVPRNQYGWTNHETRTDSRARGHAASAKTNKANKKDTPRAHELFDWDAALLGFAKMMDSMGYPLSKAQQERLDHGSS